MENISDEDPTFREFLFKTLANYNDEKVDYIKLMENALHEIEKNSLNAQTALNYLSQQSLDPTRCKALFSISKTKNLILSTIRDSNNYQIKIQEGCAEILHSYIEITFDLTEKE